MLTKPISLYPDAVSISPADNKITLSATYPASCSFETFVGEDGVEYCYASLLMGDDTYNYRVYVGDKNGVEMACFYPTIERKSNSIVLTYELDFNRTDLYGRCVGIVTSFVSKGGSRLTGNFIIKKFFSISELSKNRIYRWKIRAFEKNSISKEDEYISNTNIGYGTISEVFIPDNATVDTGCMLTIFPHTNIYDWVLGEPPREYNSKDGTYPIVDNVTNEDWYFGAGTYKSLSKYYYPKTERKGYDNSISSKQTASAVFNVLNSVRNIDKNIKYYLNINGKQYKISKYRFRPLSYWYTDTQYSYFFGSSSFYYPEGWVDKTQTHLGWSNDSGSFEGSALAKEWRISVALDNAMSEGSLDSYGNPINGYVLIDSNDTFAEGSTYKICCNYIDSDEAYFEIHSEPKITLVETNGNCEMTDIDGNVLYTESNPYSISYCNINILGEFSQTEGVEHSYYSYKIYEKNNIGDYKRIYHSSNIYNSDLRITYEDFLDGREYKIVLTIVDTNNRTFERELYFATNFTPVVNPIMARAEYYKDHNSVIVEWSPLNSITPIAKNDNFKFVDLSGGEEYNAVFIDDGNSVTYHQNDFNQPLSFSKPLFGIRFKATENTKKVAEVHSPDNIYTISMDSFYNVDEKNCDDVIIIDTATTRYVYSIKDIATTEEAIEALSTGTSPINKTLVWDNNLTWNETYTWVNGQNTNESEYEVIISSDGSCVVRYITTGETLSKIDEFSYPTPIVKESNVILYGNVYFTDMTLVNNSDIYSIDNFVNTEWQWYSDTQLLASFNGSFNGANSATIGNSKLIGYKVYKSIGNSVKLHKIAETASDETIIEDFIVGDNCSYKYYIYPLFQDQFNENLYYPNKPIETSEITLNHSVNKVVSLKKIGDETYCVNLDGVWRLMLNLDDNGYTIKNSKTFADSLNAYTQEYVGNMKYITKSVSGLIGMIDCYSGGDIVDTYDMLISWNDFVTSADLKCYVDSRGLILPGNFEAEPNVEYVKHPKSYAVAKFNWRQKSDLDIIKIYATIIPYNPIYEGVLYSDDSLGLMSIDNKLLIANGR